MKAISKNLIQKWLLDNTHGVILTLVPKRGLAAQREKELADRLEAYRSSLSDEQLEEMVRKTKALELTRSLRRGRRIWSAFLC